MGGLVVVVILIGAVVIVMAEVGYRSEQREWEERWRDYIDE